MKTFIVEGLYWQAEHRVDDTLFNSYGEAAFEAMTRGVEGYFSGGEITIDSSAIPDGEWICFRWFMVAYEKGYKNEPRKKVAAFTESVAENAESPTLAASARQLREETYTPDNIKSYWEKWLNGGVDHTPSDDEPCQIYLLADADEEFMVAAFDWEQAQQNAEHYKSKIIAVMYQPPGVNLVPRLLKG